MNIVQVYQQFPTQRDCIKYLENVRWSNAPVCPYCKSRSQSPVPREQRYHCNTCNTAYSVTVQTIFHRTKCDLQKWFLAISLFNAKERISARQLARDIEVSKDTAWFMLARIKKNLTGDAELLENIIQTVTVYGPSKTKGSSSIIDNNFKERKVLEFDSYG